MKRSSKYNFNSKRFRDSVSLKFKTIEGNLGAIKLNKYLSGLISKALSIVIPSILGIILAILSTSA